MKIVVTHSSPDMDAITSVWLIRRFLTGWENAVVKFVPAGERIGNIKNPIEKIGEDEVIHVDTGLGPLDHHQTASDNVCAASLTFDFVKRVSAFAKASADRQSYESKKSEDRMEAVRRMVKVVVDIDHFKEVFWKDRAADYHEFSVVSILDGLKLQKQDQDDFYVDFISDCLDAILHEFENRIWAEKEIKERGKRFDTRFGKGIGFETINDSVIKLSQKMGYVIVVRKDPRKGYVRIKALPALRSLRQFKNFSNASVPAARYRSPRDTVAFGDSSEKFFHAKAPRAAKEVGVDLTLAYEKLKKMDPSATWFLHVSKKMLLNGSVKNPKMRPTRLGLDDIIKVLENV